MRVECGSGPQGLTAARQSSAATRYADLARFGRRQPASGSLKSITPARPGCPAVRYPRRARCCWLERCAAAHGTTMRSPAAGGKPAESQARRAVAPLHVLIQLCLPPGNTHRAGRGEPCNCPHRRPLLGTPAWPAPRALPRCATLRRSSGTKLPVPAVLRPAPHRKPPRRLAVRTPDAIRTALPPCLR